MRCPFCGYIDQKVLDSRPARDGDAIRRRRECSGCGRRFTTFEEPERPRLFVIKKDCSRQEFSRDKCLHSMLLACRKRRVVIEDLREAAERIEIDLIQQFEEEVPSSAIGALVLRELRAIDVVAYVRFASVYKEFETIEDFGRLIEGFQAEESVRREALGVGGGCSA